MSETCAGEHNILVAAHNRKLEEEYNGMVFKAKKSMQF